MNLPPHIRKPTTLSCIHTIGTTIDTTDGRKTMKCELLCVYVLPARAMAVNMKILRMLKLFR